MPRTRLPHRAARTNHPAPYVLAPHRLAPYRPAPHRPAPRFAPEPLEPRVLLSAGMLLDVNTFTESADVSQLVNVDGTLYFSAFSPGYQYEPWKSDGTPAGTVPVFPPDLAYRLDLPHDPAQFTASGGLVYFTTGGTYASGGRQLWRSDGTPAGTVLLKDMVGAANETISQLTDVNGTLYFTARPTNGQPELWKTDGTPAGTVRVRSFPVPPGNYYGPTDLANVNGTLWFQADDGASGRELWKTDGTAAGTVQFDLYPGAFGSAPFGFTPAPDGSVVFSAYAPGAGRELWRSDGTAAGTAVLAELEPGIAGSDPASFSSAGGLAWFTALNDVGSRDVWRTDGTAAGTVRVAEARLPSSDWDSGGVVAMGGAAYFWAGLGDGFPHLFRTLGTAETTAEVARFEGLGDDRRGPLYVAGDTLYFVADAPDPALPGYKALWRSDGTAAGSVPLTAGSAYVAWMTPVGDRLYFNQHDPRYGGELWATDGTAAGTRLLKDTRTITQSSGPHGFTRAGDIAYFAADDGAHGYELWKTDGTAAGTSLVKDIVPGQVTHDFFGSPFPLLGTDDGRLLFTADDGVHGRELWVSDGTEAGTRLLRDIRTGPGPGQVLTVHAYGGAFYFAAETESEGWELWRTDGTPEGTALVKDLNPGAESSAPGDFVNFGGAMYFAAYTAEHGTELWRSDGTAGGTRRVTDINPGPGMSLHQYESHLTVAGDRLYFVAADGPFQARIWSTDGTEAGTAEWQPAADITPLMLAGMGGRLYFTVGPDAGAPMGLYRDDGPVAPPLFLGQTILRTDHEMVVAGDNLYLVAEGTDRRGGEADLWKTDGTPAGTSVVKTFLINGRHRGATDLAAVGDVLYFTGSDARGPGLWRSDGTEAGTALVLKDGWGKVVALGDDVLFAGYDPEHGSEPWLAPRARGLTADAGGPYAATEGESVALSAAGSSAPPGTSIVSYEWDFAYNGAEFNVDATGATATLPASAVDGPGTRSVAVRVRDAAGNEHVDTALLRMTNVRPTVNVTFPPPGDVSAPVELVLSSQDPGPDGMSWRVVWGDASPSEIFRGRDARPTHRYNAAGTYTVSVIPSDEDGTYPTVTGTVRIAAAVVGRHVFYNDSAFDNHTPGASFADDGAIAADKRALREGAGPATAANVTGYHRGINGIIIDHAGVPMVPALTRNDVVLKVAAGGPGATTWTTLATPNLVMRFIGTVGTARYTIVLPEGTARNAWLQVTVLANARTGLAAPDVFYFGNLSGDTGNDAAAPFVVNALDVAAVKRRPTTEPVPVTNPADINRDGRVNALDVAAVKANLTRRLAAVPPATPPPATAPAGLFSAAPEKESATALLR